MLTRSPQNRSIAGHICFEGIWGLFQGRGGLLVAAKNLDSKGNTDSKRKNDQTWDSSRIQPAPQPQDMQTQQRCEFQVRC